MPTHFRVSRRETTDLIAELCDMSYKEQTKHADLNRNKNGSMLISI